jgi:hypothetical protein
MKPIIIIDKPMQSMTIAEQEEIWQLSRINEVFVEDVNGELWQILDCTESSDAPSA